MGEAIDGAVSIGGGASTMREWMASCSACAFSIIAGSWRRRALMNQLEIWSAFIVSRSV